MPLSLFATLGPIVALSLWWAGVTFGRGEYLTVAVLLLVAVSLVGMIPVPLVLALLGRVTPRARFDDQATTIRPDRVVDGFQRWGTLGTYVAAATIAIFRPLGMVDIPLPSHVGYRGSLIVTVYVVAVFGIYEVWKAFRPAGVSFVRLTAKGFAMSQASSSMEGEWDDVVAITDRKRGKKPPYRAMAFVEFDDGRVLTQVVDDYTPGGEAMRRWVNYYWLYPNHRDELTDGRAIERLERLRRGPVRRANETTPKSQGG